MSSEYAFASSTHSLAAPVSSGSSFSKKPAGNVQQFILGSIALLHNKILLSHSKIDPATIFGF